MSLEVRFLFDCVGCSSEQLRIIAAYEACDTKREAVDEERYAILRTGCFDAFTLFEDWSVRVCGYQHEGRSLLCVEWSAIHHFFEIVI